MAMFTQALISVLTFALLKRTYRGNFHHFRSEFAICVQDELYRGLPLVLCTRHVAARTASKASIRVIVGRSTDIGHSLAILIVFSLIELGPCPIIEG